MKNLPKSQVLLSRLDSLKLKLCHWLLVKTGKHLQLAKRVDGFCFGMSIGMPKRRSCCRKKVLPLGLSHSILRKKHYLVGAMTTLYGNGILKLANRKNRFQKTRRPCTNLLIQHQSFSKSFVWQLATAKLIQKKLMMAE